MRFKFDTKEEWDELFYMVRDSNILWRKRRMECQGKINLQEDGSPGQFTLEECEGRIVKGKSMEDFLYSYWREEWE